MSPRNSLWFLAGALCATVLLVLTLGIYLLLSRSVSVPGNHTPTTASTGARQAGSLEEVTQKLAARLSATGGSDDEWKLLSQSYEYLGRADDAKRALAHISDGHAADLASVATALDGFRGGQ